MSELDSLTAQPESLEVTPSPLDHPHPLHLHHIPVSALACSSPSSSSSSSHSDTNTTLNLVSLDVRAPLPPLLHSTAQHSQYHTCMKAVARRLLSRTPPSALSCSKPPPPLPRSRCPRPFSSSSILTAAPPTNNTMSSDSGLGHAPHPVHTTQEPAQVAPAKTEAAAVAAAVDGAAPAPAPAPAAPAKKQAEKKPAKKKAGDDLAKNMEKLEVGSDSEGMVVRRQARYADNTAQTQMCEVGFQFLLLEKYDGSKVLEVEREHTDALPLIVLRPWCPCWNFCHPRRNIPILLHSSTHSPTSSRADSRSLTD